MATSNYQIFVNENLVSFQEPLFVEKGRLYIPVRFIGEQLGAAVEWNSIERSVVIKTPLNDVLKFYLDSQKVILNASDYMMDVSPIIRDERLYLPVRHVSELLHLKVTWLDEQNAIHLKSVPLYEVKKGDSLTSISKEFNTTPEFLRVRNNLTTFTIDPGTKLKVVIPSLLENREDITLLAKLIEAEAGGEPFIGQVAVGSVILNRVEDDRFPNTIESVVNQDGQFTPVMSGELESIVPSESALAAAEQAIKGNKPAKDALYFFNPANTINSFLLGREFIADIGNQRFAK